MSARQVVYYLFALFPEIWKLYAPNSACRKVFSENDVEEYFEGKSSI